MRKFLIKDNIKKLDNYFKENDKIEVVFLFGSYLTPYYTAISDIDFAVLFNCSVSILEECEVLVAISKILTVEKIDLVNLNKAPLNLQMKAISEGRLLYEKNYIKTCDYVENMLKYYNDYRITLDIFNKDYDYALEEVYDSE
ncbi:MAG: nucleotidyltransferase domain-containing protein [Clostridiales bacterium]|nr:nucleotidyltransferase domain-containing protein [Clostridiales bacterium]